MAAEMIAAAGAGLLNAAGSIANTLVTNSFNKKEAARQREWNEAMADKQNAWNYERWLEEQEYNTPVNQMKRLRDAGLNPLFYGLDGNSVGSAQAAAQPLGYERAEMSHMENPISAGLEGFTQMRSLQKDIELKNAQIDKIKQDTVGVGLDNEWKDKTMQARVESENLENEIKRGQIKLNKQELSNKEQELKKLIAETESEEERQGLIIAEKVLAEANKAKTDEERATIVALRPYEIALKEAQTEAQKAAAAASYANAAINKGLLKAGYCEKLIDQIVAQTEASRAIKENNEVQKALNEVKLAIRNGNVFDTGEPVGPAGQFIHDVLGQFFRIISITGDALGGLSGAAGAAAGAAFGSGAGGSEPPRTVVKGFGNN